MYCQYGVKGRFYPYKEQVFAFGFLEFPEGPASAESRTVFVFYVSLLDDF